MDSFLKRLNRKLEIITEDQAENSLDETLKATFNDNDKDKSNSKTISCENYIEYRINCYSIDNFLKSLNTDINHIVKKYPLQLEYDYDLFAEIYTSGITAFVFENKIHFIEKIGNINSINIQGPESTKIYDLAMQYIKDNNVLRNKQIYITNNHHELSFKLERPKDITFNEVIIDENIKEDIIDNVIFHLKHIKGSNGIILHGLTGTGKTITCAAAVNEVLKLGYSACYITNAINYSELKDLLAKFLSPCLVIFEDIDSVGQSREDTINSTISPLLQFLNGLSEKNGQYVYIATTNHIDQLDKALSNRPIRFNRKYKFDLPTEEQLDKMVDLYFKDCNITDELKKLTYNKKFTGAHIEELKRTCDIHTLKYKKTYPEVFSDCIDIINKNFGTKESEYGFRK